MAKKSPNYPSANYLRLRLPKIVIPFAAAMILLFSFFLQAEELPAGTRLEVRLLTTTGSRVSHRGDHIEATVIAPVSSGGQILVSPGSKLFGTLDEVSPVGLGLKHITASLGYRFHTLQLPNGETIPIKTQLVQVETAKERVDSRGVVHGIHPGASVSSGIGYFTAPFVFLTPAVGIPAWGIKSLIAPSANPEIYFPQGTEMILRLSATAQVPFSATEPERVSLFTPEEIAEIQQTLKSFSQQRAYLGTHPSDLVNLMILGDSQQIDRAFRATGWFPAERKSPMSLYRMYHALTKRNGYTTAPMNTLTLNGAAPDFGYQKSLNTVEKRHHVRLWQQSQAKEAWLGTAAEDVAFRFESTHWTHSIDLRIDGERAKVVNDLAFTGCVATAGLVTREPSEFQQSPEDGPVMATDGSIAVVRLNDCAHPRMMAGVGLKPSGPPRGHLVRAMTSFRDDMVRSNIVFTTYNTMKFLARPQERLTFRHKQQDTGVDVDRQGLDWLNCLGSTGQPDRSR
jgi:hypothetical protein